MTLQDRTNLAIIKSIRDKQESEWTDDELAILLTGYVEEDEDE